MTGPLRMRMATKHQPIRLVIGGSGLGYSGWTVTEVEYLDVANEADWQRYFSPASIAAMLAEHVWEHLTPIQAEKGATLCYRYLQTGGYLRIAVPDGLHPDSSYIAHVRPGGTGPGADDHKVLYTYRTLTSLLEKAGFTLQLLEYFDERGTFHFVDWDPAGGMITRSSRFDSRNTGRTLRYTSIVIDGYKA
jgi:predicted SAM-dependent methyltransferase